MALKGQMSQTFLNLAILALDISLVFHVSLPTLSGNLSARSVDSRLKTSSNPVLRNESNALLREISIKNAGPFLVVQQPAGETNYVSSEEDEVTQFSVADRYGNIGLLAHNYLSGKSFSKLSIGQEVRLEYADGKIEYFVVKEILRYQALDPKSPYSSFQNLDNRNEVLTVGQMFDRAYQGERHLTLQTCIAAKGVSSWGRLFIIATPKPESLGMQSLNLVGLPQ